MTWVSDQTSPYSEANLFVWEKINKITFMQIICICIGGGGSQLSITKTGDIFNEPVIRDKIRLSLLTS